MYRLRLIALLALILATLAVPIQRAAAQSGDTLTCDDFTNQDAAQIVFELDEDEFADLDEEGDGTACPDLPARDDGGDESATVALGTERADVEDSLGDPDDDADEDVWETGVVYESVDDLGDVGIAYIDDLAAHVILTLDEEIADAEAALDLARDYLPADADLESSGADLDDGAVLYEGTSDELADLFPEDDTYADLGGAPGDFRVILVPGNEFTGVIDIAIGAGDEYTAAIDSGTDDGEDSDDGADSTDDGAEETPETDADATEYLEAVRADLDTLQDQIDTFDTLFINAAGELSDADIDTLVDILVAWSTATTLSDAVTAPDGYEDIQATFEDLTTTLEAISLEIANGENADFDAVVSDFADAQGFATDLDDLLTAEGA